MYNQIEARQTEVIVITSVPDVYRGTFSRTIGRPIIATKTGFVGWRVPVAYDALDNPDSIWSHDEDTTLFFKDGDARPATQQEIDAMSSHLTGGISKAVGDSMEVQPRQHVRATPSNDNPFHHWNLIKGNRKLGLPEVYTNKELRA